MKAAMKATAKAVMKNWIGNLMAILIVLAMLAAAGYVGYRIGERDAIRNCRISTTDVYDPLHPEASAWNGYDQRVLIYLDGKTYEHGMTQY